MQKADHIAKQVLPTRFDALVFRAKAVLLQARRTITNFANRDAVHAVQKNDLINSPVIAESVSELWTETEPEERFLVAGKIQNLRVALRSINGVEVEAGKTFSFWKQIGRAARWRGYVKGRELREGCIIPNIGGGLCQLSNALYDAALKADFEIVERHAHSQIIAGSLAETGRDATVFWNYIDLRFRSERAFRIEAFLTADKLTVRFRGSKPASVGEQKVKRRILHADQPRSCATCGMDDCHQVVIDPDTDFGKTAYLVDEFWPEFDAYILSERTSKDRLFMPMDGKRFRRQNYAWSTDGFSSIDQSLIQTLKRSYSSRRLAAQGASRQKNLLSNYEKLAESYAKRLDHESIHLVIQQDLLPYLWRNGHLGGRTYDVLMTALPMSILQKRLDAAAVLHPESTTLGDFRADSELLNAEMGSLANARRLITPHSYIAELFDERAILLDWKLPVVKKHLVEHNNTAGGKKPRIVFAASTVGRKGCYELREALRGIDATLVLTGPTIEHNEFWHGYDVVLGLADPLAGADLVALPAFIEHRPRRLLRAAALNIPVTATHECGLANVPGVVSINSGEPETLRNEILRILG